MDLMQSAKAIGFCAALLFALPTAALAIDKKEDKQEGKKDPEAVTCKYTKVVGSRIPIRVCMTNFEWEDRKRTQMENQRSSRNRNSACPESSWTC